MPQRRALHGGFFERGTRAGGCLVKPFLGHAQIFCWSPKPKRTNTYLNHPNTLSPAPNRFFLSRGHFNHGLPQKVTDPCRLPEVWFTNGNAKVVTKTTSKRFPKGFRRFSGDSKKGSPYGLEVSLGKKKNPVSSSRWSTHENP